MWHGPTITDVDGRLVLDWPDDAPDTTEIHRAVLVDLVARANGEHPDDKEEIGAGVWYCREHDGIKNEDDDGSCDMAFGSAEAMCDRWVELLIPPEIGGGS